MIEHRASRTERLNIRGLSYNVRHWGADDAPRVFLLHGWMDSSPTFQFLADAMTRSWHLIAPDWRGFGATEFIDRPYWYADYYADLDRLLAHYSPTRPVRLVGHSMGANIAANYAAARPERVAQLAMLDFLGLKVSAQEAPPLLARWLDNFADPPAMSSYADRATLAQRLRAANPRLSESRAGFLAAAVSRTRPDGRVEMACDPWHKVPAPTPYHVEDAMASWRSIACPTLLLIADRGYVQQRFGDDSEEVERRLACFGQAQVEEIADCGHNLQHDQPERLAAALEAFLQPD